MKKHDDLGLFADGYQRRLERQMPLALRMRPRSLDEFVGQQHIVGPGTSLRRSIEQDTISSLILYGPAGTGKTSLAGIIAAASKAHWEQLSAVTAGVGEVRDVIKAAQSRLATSGERTALFIDEIHRFNKAQQDVLLPAVEEGLVVLIGATTENPFFEVNAPLLSRSKIFELRPLSETEIGEVVRTALSDSQRGLGGLNVELSKDALAHIAAMSGGDGRAALNTLALAVESLLSAGGRAQDDGVMRVTLSDVEDAAQRRAVTYGAGSDAHYDTISAFIKSLRGSDPDAALYWLALMLKAGEDPKFIARRMIIFASEDIGLADSRALGVATDAAEALGFVGLPEARLNLAHAAIYLALAPKSNSVIEAIDKAARDVEEECAPTVPGHLRDSSYRGAKELGRGEGYKYPHSFPGHTVDQSYLPDSLVGKSYYKPGELGEEGRLAAQHKSGFLPRKRPGSQ